MINVNTARELLDFGARIGQGQRAEEQLQGAVAIHNLLDRHGIAYLADEVGMGKTYVALGAVALFRHFNPQFRVLVLSPRENIQRKWMKELKNFVSNNVRHVDLRVKAQDGRPARPLVRCDNLLDLVHETTLAPNRDFFARLTSFSLALGDDPSTWRKLRDDLRDQLPWMQDEVFSLRSKKDFKDNFARALCCALPQFDLVIVDEAHNLKHGFSDHVSARNRVLSLVLGHPSERPDAGLFPGYGSRAARVLFLSATPIEETYRQLWNQLDVFGLGGQFDDLRRQDLEEEQKKVIASRFLIRRVTAIQVGDQELTKNLYRREWRRGGAVSHDEPIRIVDDRQRLMVALVQKKVSELLGHERFNNNFQIGMLASFESFLETAKVKRAEDESGNFDDVDQTEDSLEREGIDVQDVNRLARSYRQRFGREMPHPKMDALVDRLAGSWTTGRKALVFVRRVASVKELKRKLDERYDDWLIGRLARELPAEVQPKFDEIVAQFRREKMLSRTDAASEKPENEDRGGTETFFAWFFRGEGPKGVISGANIQQRFVQRGAAYATFFEDNHVMALLDARPGTVEERLAETLGLSTLELRSELQRRSAKFMTQAARIPRADRFEAVQAAAFEMLKELRGSLGEEARVIWHERFEPVIKAAPAKLAPDVADYLELPTFWTELRSRPELCNRLWPQASSGAGRSRFRQREQRAQLLAGAARLGHAFIDLYVMTVQRLKSLDLRAQESSDDENRQLERQRIEQYLDILETQMLSDDLERPWGAFDELSAIADNYELILDVNAPEARELPLSETARLFGTLLGRQQPIGGMSGQVNQTLVRQFRLPGYPLALVTTDLLQEGEDLHPFCAEVHHYGISWTPSAMEQRIGRVDRVLSQTDRHLSKLKRPLEGEDHLQVFYPHLEDSVEVLQVQRVLERMNTFLRLMHEGLTASTGDSRRLDVAKEFVADRRYVEPIRTKLETAFPITSALLKGPERGLAIAASGARQTEERFLRLQTHEMPFLINWEPPATNGMLLGTMQMKSRQQPFCLTLTSVGNYLAVRCVSPVGCVTPGERFEEISADATSHAIHIGAILTREKRSYDLTVEGSVLLGDEQHDAARVAGLIRRVASQADVLEQRHLPGRDEPIATFRVDLEQEVTREH